MPEPAPTVIHDAGHLPLIPDVGLSWPAHIVILLILAWLLFGPVVVFKLARRARFLERVGVYAVGALIGVTAMLILMLGWPDHASFDERLMRGFLSLWPQFAAFFLGIGSGLCAIAALLGCLAGRRRAVAG